MRRQYAGKSVQKNEPWISEGREPPMGFAKDDILRLWLRLIACAGGRRCLLEGFK
jgi:hypothetical protein